MPDYLADMRKTIAEIDDPIEASFFKAHLAGMEQFAELQQRWKQASAEDRPVWAEQITALRTKLLESLEVLKP